MKDGFARYCLCWLLAVLALAVAQPAFARESAPARLASCHAYSESGTGIQEARAGALEWNCSRHGWRDGQKVGWLRFDSSLWQGGDTPVSFSTRITRFESIAIFAIDSNGAVRERQYGESDARPIEAEPAFALPLPPIRDETQTILVRIEGAHTVTAHTDARLITAPHAHDWFLTEIVLLAVVIGMLVMPLIFDISYFLALRDRFVLLHGLMVVAMVCYIIIASGLASIFINAPLWLIAIGGPLMWAAGVACSAFFLASFLEPGALSPAMRKALICSGWWALVVPGTMALQLPATQPFDNQVYFLGFLPIIALYGAAMLQAFIRGSLWVRFLAVAWLPIIAAAIERLARGMGLYAASSLHDHFLFLSLGVEVIIMALGVTNRFLAVRQQRDSAWAAAQALEELSERDPLTGLMNRRAIEPRFAHLWATGFDTLALIDLDHFKAINDQYGHAIGDRVLQAAATALEPDPDTLAIRMGGEEFLLLLRGPHAEQRAERRRQAIATRIAGDVKGLDRLVTASMGLVECPAHAIKADFNLLYTHCDRLLYEAKAAGRNRMMGEKIQRFGDRRRADRRQGPRRSAAAA